MRTPVRQIVVSMLKGLAESGAAADRAEAVDLLNELEAGEDGQRVINFAERAPEPAPSKPEGNPHE